MTDGAFGDVDAVFRHPERYVGTVEANVEVKVVLPVLVELGWNATRDIALCFQIERARMGAGAKAAHAADFALRKRSGLVAVGEGKQWHASGAAWADGEAQVRRYQRALALPRAFLTTGRRWLVLGAAGDVLLDREFRDPGALVRELEPVLAPGSIPEATGGEDAWAYGLQPTPRWPAGDASLPSEEPPSVPWDPLEYADMDVRHRVERLIGLSERSGFERVSGSKALILRFPSRKSKLLEYRPHGPNIDVALPRAELIAEGVPAPLIDDYGILSKALRDGRASFDDLEALLTRIIESVTHVPLSR